MLLTHICYLLHSFNFGSGFGIDVGRDLILILMSKPHARCLARFGAGAFSVTSVSASNQPRGHGLRQQSLRP